MLQVNETQEDFEVGEELQVECSSFNSKGIPVFSISREKWFSSGHPQYESKWGLSVKSQANEFLDQSTEWASNMYRVMQLQVLESIQAYCSIDNQALELSIRFSFDPSFGYQVQSRMAVQVLVV